MPNTELSKILQSYISRHPKRIYITRKVNVELSTKAIYGSIVASSFNLAAKQRVFPEGIECFFNVKDSMYYPLVAANYQYKARAFEVLMLKDHDPEVESGKFKNWKDALKNYVMLYWNSAESLYRFKGRIQPHETKRYMGDRYSYETRKIFEKYEVLAYMGVPPQYLLIKARHKQYIPFMEWLYKHRGLYTLRIKNAKTSDEKGKWMRQYTMFKDNYKRYLRLVRRVKEKHGRVMIYAPYNIEQ